MQIFFESEYFVIVYAQQHLSFGWWKKKKGFPKSLHFMCWCEKQLCKILWDFLLYEHRLYSPFLLISFPKAVSWDAHSKFQTTDNLEGEYNFLYSMRTLSTRRENVRMKYFNLIFYTIEPVSII